MGDERMLESDSAGANPGAGMRIFASYAVSDRARVEPVLETLRAHGMSVWNSHNANPGSPKIAENIRRALDTSDALLAFVSVGVTASLLVDVEMRQYRGLTSRRRRLRAVVVRLDESPAPTVFADAQVIDARATDASEMADRIIAALEWVGSQDAYKDDETSQGIAAIGWAEVDATTEMGRIFGHEPSPPQAPPPASHVPPAAPGGPPVVEPYDPSAPLYSPQPLSPDDASLYASMTPSAGGDATRATGEPVAPVALERVAFAAYCPKEMEPRKTSPLLVYLALDDAGALAQVAALAAERLAGRRDQFRSGLADARMTLRRGAKLRITPSLPGFKVNPQWMDITWDENAQQHEFTIRAETAPEGRPTEGAVRVYQGLTLRAEIPLSIFVTRGAGSALTPDDFNRAIARIYRRVFASYSHRDTPVVVSCEAAARAMGDRYLRDVMTLQSGQVWNEQLLRMVVEADVFQLFWSKGAAKSPFVRQEWEFALSLAANRPNFVRPVYWSSAPFEIPPELSPLHFAPLDLSALGWGAFRRWMENMRAG